MALRSIGKILGTSWQAVDQMADNALEKIRRLPMYRPYVGEVGPARTGEERMRQAILELREATTAELAESTGLGAYHVRSLLARMRASGDVVLVRESKRLGHLWRAAS